MFIRNLRVPFLGLLLAAADLAVVLMFSSERLSVASRRQCMFEVFCSTSTDKSRKSSSLL